MTLGGSAGRVSGSGLRDWGEGVVSQRGNSLRAVGILDVSLGAVFVEMKEAV